MHELVCVVCSALSSVGFSVPASGVCFVACLLPLSFSPLLATSAPAPSPFVLCFVLFVVPGRQIELVDAN